MPAGPPPFPPPPPPGPKLKPKPKPKPKPRVPLVDGLRMAVGTLTALPVPAPRRIDRRVAAVAMLLAPLAGLVPALASAVVGGLADVAGAAPLLAATLAVGTVALTTRGLHLDGLADTVDGLAAAYDRGHALEIMRRGDTGPSGAAALVLVLLGQTAALAQALERHGAAALVVAVVVGRTALLLGCLRGVPPARPEGLGATVAGTVPRTGAAVVLALVAGTGWAMTGPAAVVAVLAATVAVAALLARAAQRLGGITGDVLGAGVETATMAAAVALALTP